jgi:hypothetical protein
VAEEQRAWIAELEKHKAWLEGQWHSSRAEVIRWQAEVAQWQKSPWGRLGIRLGVVSPAKLGTSEPTEETDGDRSSKS